jgi:hypothetical protein
MLRVFALPTSCPLSPFPPARRLQVWVRHYQVVDKAADDKGAARLLAARGEARLHEVAAKVAIDRYPMRCLVDLHFVLDHDPVRIARRACGLHHGGPDVVARTIVEVALL